MIIPNVGIVTNYILNNTGIEWFEFQDDVQEAMKTSLHCLPKNKMDILLKAQKYKNNEDLYYEIWGCVRDYQLDVAIIKVNKPKEEEI